MKITKRQLRRIIKEEKQKMLEMYKGGRSNAERSLGLYANTSTVDQITDSILNVLQEVEMGAHEDGMEGDESEDMAVAAAILAVAHAFQAAGRIDVYQALIQELKRFEG